MRGGHWLLGAHICQVRGAAGARGPGVLPAGSAGTVAPKNHHRVIGTVLASVAPPPAPAQGQAFAKAPERQSSARSPAKVWPEFGGGNK